MLDMGSITLNGHMFICASNGSGKNDSESIPKHIDAEEYKIF